VSEELEQSGLDLARMGPVKLHISGCPCACGRHPLAQVGLYGAARRVDGRLVPHYVFQLGGRVGEGRTRLAEGGTALPAKNVPAFLKDLFAAFLNSNGPADFDAFTEAGGRETAEQIAGKYRDIPDFEQDNNAYFDWGADEPFSLAGRGPGECGAGVFDLIELDLATAAEALAAGQYFAATVHAARALLVTRGEEPSSVLESLDLFRKLFVAEGLVAPRLAELIDDAARCATLENPETALRGRAEDASALVTAVKTLYENMDASLRFTVAPQREAPQEPTRSPDREQDFRGVRCPLNYVKTKLTLEQMQLGEVLAVVLDEAGSRNVPTSLSNDGQEVLAVEKEGKHWRVLIRKAR
jgi:sulfite reductase (ferredoxin)